MKLRYIFCAVFVLFASVMFSGCTDWWYDGKNITSNNIEINFNTTLTTDEPSELTLILNDDQIKLEQIYKLKIDITLPSVYDDNSKIQLYFDASLKNIDNSTLSEQAQFNLFLIENFFENIVYEILDNWQEVQNLSNTYEYNLEQTTSQTITLNENFYGVPELDYPLPENAYLELKLIVEII